MRPFFTLARWWSCGLLLLAGFGPAHAATPAPVTIQVGADAAELERFAATELQRYLQALFHVDAAIVTQTPGAGTVFLVGTPEHQPRLRAALGDAPSALTDQSILLRKLKGADASTFVISGGSPRAVLWGVYELVERYGVRYLLHGDALPENAGPFTLPEIDEVLTPNLTTRCWRLINGFAMGPESWGLKENEAFIDQLAKMKYNRIHLTFWPWQSYSDYAFHGVKKTTGVSFFGYRFPITNDMIGRNLYGDLAEYENPEFAGVTSYAQRLAAARRLAHGIIARGRQRGMDIGITIEPLDFPTEFRAALPGAQTMKQLGSLTIGPGPDQDIDDPLIADLVATVIRSYVRDYPEADVLHISVPEHRGWTGQAERVWGILQREYNLDPSVTFEKLRAQARARTSYAAGDRAEQELKGDITSIYFLSRTIRDHHLLQREGQKDIRLVYVGVSEELLPFMPKLLPPEGGVLTLVDYTASRVAKQVDVLRRIPAQQMPSYLIYTLADDNVGVLPQIASSSFHTLNQVLREGGWRGFYTRYWMIGELDPPVHYLAKSSWDARVTPESAVRDLLEPLCGPAAVAPFSTALGLIETATNQINAEALSLAFPIPGMLLKHYSVEKWYAPPMPAQIGQYRDFYRQALAKVREARDASRPQGRPFLDYYVQRLEFTLHFLNAIDTVRAAGAAARSNQKDEAVKLLDRTLEETTAGLKAYAAVARDNSDRGTIAILNEYTIRDVRREREKLLSAPAAPAASSP